MKVVVRQDGQRQRSPRARRQAGFSLVELIVAFTILLILTSMAVPLARFQVRREREKELRAGLREMRDAINKYKDVCDQGKIQAGDPETYCFPPTLEILVEGVKLTNTISGNGQTGKLKFLRRIPGVARMFSMCTRKPWIETAMVNRIRSGKWRRGFTLIELMVVMAIIAVLLSIAVPIYQKSITRAKESVLRNNLFTIRTMIDEYTVDKQKAPDSLEDLVSDGYLRQVPQDPMTSSDQTWKPIMEETPVGGSSSSPGLFDVRSGSDKKALDGSSYSDW
jgi:general secretion pathway protein G